MKKERKRERKREGEREGEREEERGCQRLAIRALMVSTSSSRTLLQFSSWRNTREQVFAFEQSLKIGCPLTEAQDGVHLSSH